MWAGSRWLGPVFVSTMAPHVLLPLATVITPSGRMDLLSSLKGTSMKVSIFPAGAPSGFRRERPNSVTAPRQARRAEAARLSCASIPEAEEIGIRRATGHCSSLSIPSCVGTHPQKLRGVQGVSPTANRLSHSKARHAVFRDQILSLIHISE